MRLTERAEKVGGSRSIVPALLRNQVEAQRIGYLLVFLDQLQHTWYREITGQTEDAIRNKGKNGIDKLHYFRRA